MIRDRLVKGRIYEITPYGDTRIRVALKVQAGMDDNANLQCLACKEEYYKLVGARVGEEVFVTFQTYQPEFKEYRNAFIWNIKMEYACPLKQYCAPTETSSLGEPLWAFDKSIDKDYVRSCIFS